MTSRLFAVFGLATVMVGFASAQDAKKATPDDRATAKAQVKEALEAASEDLPKAIGILDKALKVDPENREAIYLLGAMTTVRGEEVKDKAERIALFHRSTAAFARLQSLYKEPTPYEKAFLVRSQLNEARALALEDKTAESLALLKKAIASGFDDLDAVDGEPDFESVRKLPELRTLMESTYKAKVAEARREVTQEMAQSKAFNFDFELKDTDDKTVALADYKGKVTIVDVWGTWCPPCRKEIPHFVAIYKEFKPKGLEIVGINCNEEGNLDAVKKTIKDFAKENKIEYKCVLNDDKTESKIPGFEGYPTTLFLDKTGKVRLTLVGYTPKYKLEAIITTLLDEGLNPPGNKVELKAK